MNVSKSAKIWVGAYVASILFVNWLFAPTQLVPGLTQFSSPLGDLYLANLVVGLVFVLRDYAQRAIGHRVLIATAVAGLITYFMVDKTVALASITAFAISEMVDWSIYSFTNRPLQERILVSSMVAVPLDTVIFQHLAGYLSPAAFTTEVASKALGVLVIWYILKMRNDNTPDALPA